MADVKLLQVRQPGKGIKVRLPDDGTVEGLVTAVMIRLNDVVQYEVAYWYDGERRTEWLYEAEVELESYPDYREARRKIGYSL